MLYVRSRVARLCLVLVVAAAVGAPPTANASPAGTNLIVNGDAEAGYCTKDFNAATTMPGWTITRGSPDVICYSADSFARPTGGSSGRAFFAPGDEGDSTVT